MTPTWPLTVGKRPQFTKQFSLERLRDYLHDGSQISSRANVHREQGSNHNIFIT